MTATELKDLFDRVLSWPKAAQDELLSMANAIENALHGHQHVASEVELQITEAAITSIEVTPDASSTADEVDILKSMERLVAAKQKPAKESGSDA
ncbi:hypothetical protein CK489_03925 [Bradyrhizobium sp. UFLA03-84]|uniref:hypothetical protein n=1 Tax=Bradyrhizobium sp. UFLA03-84 TaxID=418599 RepID=UPI000BAE496A|nr:hypothetical protein [Bradyrhizobium sp. UFLA03-84]PAY09731.1 hypothetical protein CK489_03925 [Bradyrhizobium sp. UFLA03-84]